jgi:hypothetical protein
MERTPDGTPVGVDDPYAHVERCDHLTDDGRCRFAAERPDADPAFARERRDDDVRCMSTAAGADADPDWAACPHFCSLADGHECARCGIEEVRMAHSGARPLLEEHHLSYPDGEREHEITVALCRWCHAKVHSSFARVDDDVNPDPEAVAAREARRSRELDELAFDTARERRDEREQ